MTDLLAKAFQALEVGLIVADPQGNTALINPAACQALGLEAAQTLGRPLSAALASPELLAAPMEKGSLARFEIQLNEERTYAVSLAPLPGGGRVVTLYEITALKKLDRAKSDFVNAVSHDLRSPLTSILGYVDLIARVGAVNAQQAEFIQRIQASARHITTLINELLDLGRLEAGYDAHKEPVALAAVVNAVVDGLSSRLAAKRHSLQVSVPAGLPGVHGNPLLLRQLFSNLLVNASDYTPAGGHIAVEASAEAGQMIVRISDTGVGIPLEEQHLIFNKFYRGSNIPPEQPGTGLGLAIVRSIVESHRGRIWVDSRPGQGTTFTIVLPLAEKP